MKIAMTIHALVAGGAERVATNMANGWVARGDDVVIITIDSEEREPFYPLDPRVRRIGLGHAGTSTNRLSAVKANAGRINALRSALTSARPDIVISHMAQTNVITILAGRLARRPVIVMEHSDPLYQNASLLWRIVRDTVYPLATRVVLLTEGSRSRHVRWIQRQATVIPNPIDISLDRRTRDLAGAAPPFTAIAMGRLIPVKGFDRLIDAFAPLAAEHPDWRLVIWGEGAERTALERQIARLAMDERISLPGTTTQPHQEMGASDLFILSSRHEGFPMALCEAMACGLPVVATDCESGPRDIIRPGVDGLLVPEGDAAALRDMMKRLMTDQPERARFGHAAPGVLDRFSTSAILDRWDRLIAEARGI